MKRDPKKAAAIVAARKKKASEGANIKAAPAEAPAKVKTIYYSVTLFVSRPFNVKKEAIRKHYLWNKDPITFYNTEAELRAAHEKALRASFGPEYEKERKEKGIR